MRRPSSSAAGRFEFNLWSDNNNNPEQCNVPDGFRSNAISNHKPTLSQLCLAEGGY
jgi:hypothetical protein